MKEPDFEPMIPDLPRIMVAPNGAHKTKADHPALPITISQTVETAKACFDAGANALHAHVRDEDGKHVLDAGLYQELLSKMKRGVPHMAVQITTEATGRYSPQQQRALVEAVVPDAVSIALREMMPDGATKETSTFYAWAQEAEIQVQHILYSDEDLQRLIALIASGDLPEENLKLLFVLGRYSDGQQSNPDDLTPFLHTLAQSKLKADWAVCAFGLRETDCLLDAIDRGGKARIGFENSLHNRDGSPAKDNAERVRELVGLINQSNKGDQAGSDA